MKNRLHAIFAAIICNLGVYGGTYSLTNSVTSTTNQTTADSYGYSSNVDTTVFVTLISVLAIVSVVLWIAKIFVLNALQVGGCRFFIQNQTTEGLKTGVVGSVFKGKGFGNIVLTMLLRDIFIVLWSLLFVIPGIIKAYEYLMVPYILAENPEMPHKEAFQLSKQMMYGKKWETFVMNLSFIGWSLLGSLTCGILNLLFVNPYYYATMARLYTFNKEAVMQEQYIQ